ncbi:MAG: hypothetical protein ACTSYI_09775 [Promethearchaeota archaeon]
MSSFSFSQNALQKAEEDFKAVKIDREKNKVSIGVASIISKYVNINELAARGFVRIAIRDAQQELKVEIKNMSDMDPPTKKNFIKTVFTNIRNKLVSILKNPSNEDIENLKKAINEAYQFRLSQPQ